MARYEKHNEHAREAIKDALLALLGEKPFDRISMSDVARQAGISRSTLYLHFPNLQVPFEACVQDFLSESRSLKAQLKTSQCSGCENGQPFCEMVRNAGKYQALVNDPHFLPEAMQQFLESGEGRRVVDDYVAMGIDARRARILARFQMTGCFTIATTDRQISNQRTSSQQVSDQRTPDQSTGAWASIRDTIDTFILGGINAVRSKEANKD